MSQDIVSDALNELMNAKKARKTEITIKKHSKLLRNILDIAKNAGYLDYSVEGKTLTIQIKDLNEIKAIKPRFTVSVKKIDYYKRRFLPAKDFGFLIVSTNKGLMIASEAQENKLGGCLIAYVY
jgi:small subunit ribosomal protein S8